MRKHLLRTIHIGLLMAAFVVTGAAASDNNPYEGTWTNAKTGCCKVDDDSVISFHQGRYTAHETVCTIKDSTKTEDPSYGASWRLVMDCESEGEVDTAVLWVTPNEKEDILTLTWDRSVADVSADVTFYRCDNKKRGP